MHLPTTCGALVLFGTSSQQQSRADQTSPPLLSYFPLTLTKLPWFPLCRTPPPTSQTKGALIDSSKHRVLTCAHPSPLSATRKPDPFIGSECFKKANEALEELGHGAVDWNVL